MKNTNEFENLQPTAVLEMPSYSIKGIKDGTSFIIKALGEIKTKDDIDHKTGERKKTKSGEPASLNLMHVVDANGVEGEMVLPVVINNAMNEAVKTGKLTGRFFRLEKIKSETNKATQWRIDEMGVKS